MAFRARQPNEDMGAYLHAKQAYEIQTTGTSGVQFGSTLPKPSEPKQYYYYYDRKGNRVNYFGTKTQADAYAQSQGWMSNLPASSSEIVNYLNTLGQPSDYKSVLKLAESFGIPNYSGTPAQQSQLFNIIQGKTGNQITQATGKTSQQIQDKILRRVTNEKSAYPYQEEGYREWLIDNIASIYGEEYRQFATDTIYRELRSPEEPTYQPPSYDVYKGGEEGSEYNTGNEDFNEFIKFARELLQQMKDSGKIVNPAIEITPELIKQFEEQAIAEYSPYYKGQFSAIKGDLETDLSYLSEQYKRAVESKETTFKQNLETQREAEASRGMIFSGGRMTREQSLAQAEERSIAGLGTSLGYQAQKAGTKAERTIGSLNLGGVTYPSYKPYSVSTKGMGGFAPLNERNLWNLTGGITGSLEREQLTAQQLRQAELEEAERKKRALTFYQ